jgi:hypothetical protein
MEVLEAIVRMHLILVVVQVEALVQITIVMVVLLMLFNIEAKVVGQEQALVCMEGVVLQVPVLVCFAILNTFMHMLTMLSVEAVVVLVMTLVVVVLQLEMVVLFQALHYIFQNMEIVLQIKQSH